MTLKNRLRLFEPLGIIDVGWATSPQGVYIGAGEMWLKPHDMAKFGWLYLNKGRWGNRQIVPLAWVEVSTRRHIDATLIDHYGYQWWVDAAGYYMAVGIKGQRIFVVPKKNIVAVFTSDLKGLGEALILKNLLDFYIIPAAASPDTLPSNTEEQVRLDALVNSAAKAIGFTWLWNNTVPITTFLVSAYKDSKCIFLWADTWKYHDKVEPIVQSLTFK